MKQKLEQLYSEARDAISKAYALPIIEELRVEFVGRKGRLTELLKGLKDLGEDARKEMGALANKIKTELEQLLNEKLQELRAEEFSKIADKEWIDVTMPGTVTPHGSLHLVTHTINEIVEVFHRIGYTRYLAPEIDWDYYAFETLNMPKDHPARDDWETFFIDEPENKKWGRQVLVPHTSNMQVRALRELKPPLRLINISRVYRRQSDTSHLPMFHQVELLAVDEQLTIADLKGTIEYFMRHFFGAKRKFRFRPYHFKFTEPSFEVDIDCDVCHGDVSLGCRLCKRGWLELGGAGMTHPNVLNAGGVDAQKYSAFAFGFGVERITMMREGLRIPDIRMLVQSDMRFLKQF